MIPSNIMYPGCSSCSQSPCRKAPGISTVITFLSSNVSIRDNNRHTYDVIYDICVFNNNDTPSSGHLCNNNDTPGCISGVENDCTGTVQYGETNISFIDICGVIVVHLAYNSVALVTTLETISSSSGQSFIRLSSELAPIPSLSSNIFRLSSDCDLVCLEYVPVAPVASLKIISSLSSPYLSPAPRFLCSLSPGLYSSSSRSYIQSPSFISIISLLTIEPSFNPSIALSTISVSHVILLTTYCVFNSPLNPFSLILMIMFMIIGLCCFPGSSPIPVTYLSIYVPPLIVIYYIQKCTSFSGHPFCTIE